MPFQRHWYHDSEVNRVFISATIILFFVPAELSLLRDRCYVNRKCLLVYISACKPSVFVESLLKIQNIYVILLFSISPSLPWVNNYYKTKD